ncbi:MAG TPA: response regulator [Anaerovoracaceae bacterium]|nr:response regulator [Anaerovoracaceae bacterium]
MPKSIQVLIVEDSKYCADLNVRELKRGGFDVSWKRVETEEAMSEMLNRNQWDIILSDHSTPYFNAVQALFTRNRISPNTPFIIVSEDVSPENIRFAMENGCCAYLLKENLHQLAILVKKIIER